MFSLESKVARVLKKHPYKISFRIRDNIVFLEGEVESHSKWVEIGLSVGRIKGVEGVVNKIRWKSSGKEAEKEEWRRRVFEEKRNTVVGEYDVVIIGGGVVGAAVARELSKYELKVALLEKSTDIAAGTTKANNGMIHAGVEPPRWTLKRRLNVKGNAMYVKLAEELGFRFNRVGSLWLITPRTLAPYRRLLPGQLYSLVLKHVLPLMVKIKGLINGVRGIRIVRGRRIFELEPFATRDAVAAVFIPSTGVVDPYEVAVALAENAEANGVEIHLRTEVVGFIKENDSVKGVVTNKGVFLCRFVVNSAGLYADEVAALAGAEEYTIHPRKGVLLVFHRDTGVFTRHCLAEIILPQDPYTKGGGINPTVHGNVLWGPTAVEVPDKDDASVSREEIEFVLSKYSAIIPGFPKDRLIRFFAGVRAATFTEDFVIRPAKWVRNLLHVAGIQSPGLAASPAIAEYALEKLMEMGLRLKPKTGFNPRRRPVLAAASMSLEELDEKTRMNPAWGRIVCTCEFVSEAEVLEAVRRGAKTLDAVKRRTRAGMGECQGSFCTLEIALIISKETGVPLNELLKEEGRLFNGPVRGEHV
ncbi:MAG: FAD-dependent oxidoreductase [Candidatus Brockarchaeota archaeon]|nr:FAD-dependent oxidoreductase [Candidatus Brockarchaeota archaeon]